MKRKYNKEYKKRKFCRYCGDTEDLTIDHKHPVILGGEDLKNNLQTLCGYCNSIKSDIPDKHFRLIMRHGVSCFIKKHSKNERFL